MLLYIYSFMTAKTAKSISIVNREVYIRKRKVCGLAVLAVIIYLITTKIYM